jgi:hypothetical protein
MQQNSNDIEVALLRDLSTRYPFVLQIKTVAEILQEDVPTIRARIRRGSFQVAVRQEPGGRQYVLLVDLVHFIVSGDVQLQPKSRPSFLARNQNGINGTRSRGRPPKSDQLRRQNGGDLK